MDRNFWREETKKNAENDGILRCYKNVTLKHMTILFISAFTTESPLSIGIKFC